MQSVARSRSGAAAAAAPAARAAAAVARCVSAPPPPRRAAPLPGSGGEAGQHRWPAGRKEGRDSGRESSPAKWADG